MRLYSDIVRRMRIYICLLPLLLFFQEVRTEPLNVAVASNLTHALTEISEAYYRASGNRVNLTFGSSGNFARQIAQGAPFRVFICAAEKYVDFVRANGARISASKVLVYGGLSLYVPETSRLERPGALEDVLNILQYGDYRRMSIANPEHAPFGQAARDALVNAGVWVVNHRKLLLGENAAQAMQFCLSGSVDLCIVPSSFPALKQFAGKGTSFQLPERWHAPLAQYAVLLGEDNEQGVRYYDYLSSRSSAGIFRKHGYRAVIGN